MHGDMKHKTISYDEFLLNKIKRFDASGFSIDESDLNAALFDFQKYIVKLALFKGRFAIFSECGTGKTLMELEWANQVVKHTNAQYIYGQTRATRF